jgi:hypothetical protein
MCPLNLKVSLNNELSKSTLIHKAGGGGLERKTNIRAWGVF